MTLSKTVLSFVETHVVNPAAKFVEKIAFEMPNVTDLADTYKGTWYLSPRQHTIEFVCYNVLFFLLFRLGLHLFRKKGYVFFFPSTIYSFVFHGTPTPSTIHSFLLFSTLCTHTSTCSSSAMDICYSFLSLDQEQITTQLSRSLAHSLSTITNDYGNIGMEGKAKQRVT